MYLFLLGLIIGIAGTKLWELKQAKNIRFTVLEYISGVIWLLWSSFGVAFVIISIGEGEMRAASVGTLIFGGVALLSLLGMRFFHLKRSKNPSVSNSVSN